MKRSLGFTLVELLAVIAIVGILTLIAVPNAIKLYNEAILKEMVVQESNIKNAANIYLEDYCNSKLDDRLICPSSYEEVNNKDEKYVCLSDLQEANDSYIGSVKYKKDSCKGIIVYKKDKDTDLYIDAKTYLYCGNSDTGEYNYITDETINPADYSRCNIKLNNEMYYFNVMEEKLSEIHLILQRENELVVQMSNETNTSNDREKIKKEIQELNKEINSLYDFKYLDAMILHKDNILTGKYVVKVVSSSGLKLDSLTFNDYVKDEDTVKKAIKDVSYFRSYIGAEENALEYRLEFNKCENDSCKLDIVKNMVMRIYELSYNATYNNTYIDDDLVNINLEIQKLFDNLDVFSKKTDNSSISKSIVFPTGKDVLNKNNSKIIYEEASSYLKNIKSDLNTSAAWEDEVSMYETAKGALSNIISITDRQSELINNCISNSSVNDELNELYNEIENIKNNTTFNTNKILSDSTYYKDYLLYDLSDNDLKNISCSNSKSSSVISKYQRKINLNIVSINANIDKAKVLIDFVKCNDSSCVLDVVKGILNTMIGLSDKAMSVGDILREEYNIEYTTYFKALNHIALISKNDSYSTKSLGIDNTNILTLENAKSAKEVLNSKISNIK